MRICVPLPSGHKQCFEVPILRFPTEVHIPGPGPVEKQGLLHDAVILQSIRAAAAHISDARVKQALGESLGTVTKTFKESAGPHIEVHLDD